MPVVRSVLGEEFYQMYRWFNEEGFLTVAKNLQSCYALRSF
jgi:hypothetical protein